MSRLGGVKLPGTQPAAAKPSHRRSWLRILLPIGTLVVVLVPILIHVLRVDDPDSRISGAPRVTTFYVSPDGDDSRDGSSPANAWRSLQRADAVTFMPGDRLLLRGGARLRGSIGFGRGEAGDPSAPVVVESYGGGRATIETTGFSGIAVYDTAGIEIRNVAIVGDQDSYVAYDGIKVHSSVTEDRDLDHVVISQVDVSGFKHGISIEAGEGAKGFHNVHIGNAVLHGNQDAGLVTSGPGIDAASPRYAHSAVTVSDVEVYDNRGDPADRWNTTGNGIVLSNVDGGLIERSRAHDNGSLCDSLSGPIGIWAYDSKAVVIEHNVSFRNRVAGGTDGGGFGLDRSVSSSILQYNLSYENDGAGYLIYSPPETSANTDSVVRFNISDNDARKLPLYAGIRLDGVVTGAQIYHNTVRISANGSGLPAALKVTGEQSAATIRNNIFLGAGTGAVAGTDFPTAKVLFQGNNIFNGSGAGLVSWGESGYATLADWRAATGQERRESVDTGHSADPDFVTAAASDSEPDRAKAFVPKKGSPLVGKALDLRSLFGVDPGPQDFFGRPVTGPVAIGAAQPGS
jgi:hypothetical protein